MAGGIHGFANRIDRRETAGRRLVVQHADRLDFMRLVLAQMLFDFCRIGAGPPIAGNELGFESELLRHGFPLRRELAGLDHQYPVARRQRVDERCFPRTCAGRGVNDHRIGGLEDRLDAVEAALGEFGEFRSAMVDDRGIHRSQYAVWQRRRPRDLQEMAPGGARCILRHIQNSFGQVGSPRRRMSESARGLWR
jgi:hypothetical protein